MPTWWQSVGQQQQIDEHVATFFRGQLTSLGARCLHPRFGHTKSYRPITIERAPANVPTPPVIVQEIRHTRPEQLLQSSPSWQQCVCRAQSSTDAAVLQALFVNAPSTFAEGVVLTAVQRPNSLILL